MKNILSKTKTWLFSLIVLWLLGLSIFHFGFSYQEKNFNDYPSKVSTFSDKIECGQSEIDLIQKGDTLGYSFELRHYLDSLNWPWVELQIALDSNMNISGYDYLEFDIKSSKKTK